MNPPYGPPKKKPPTGSDDQEAAENTHPNDLAILQEFRYACPPRSLALPDELTLRSWASHTRCLAS